MDKMIGKEVIAPVFNRDYGDIGNWEYYTAKVVGAREVKRGWRHKRTVKQYAVEFKDNNILWVDAEDLALKGKS